MTHADPTHRPPPQPRSRRILRLMLLAMMVLCGAAMAALLLSDPMVSAKVKSTVESVTAKFASPPSESVFDEGPSAPLTMATAPVNAASATTNVVPNTVADEGATDDPVAKAPPIIRVRRAGVLVEG